MSDRLLKESDVLRAIDKRIEVLSQDPVFIRKNGIIDIMGIKKYILAIPSADRPQGEWIEWVAPNGIDWGAKCSCCDYIINATPIYGSNFCPNCGAQMFVKDINVSDEEGAEDGNK